MKILLNITKFDYGKKEQGYSFEYDNFYRTFKELKHEILLFDFASEEAKYGMNEMNIRFIKKIDTYKPDIIFSVFHEGHFQDNILAKIKTKPLKHIIWMTDDEWLWEGFSRRVCHLFHHVVTTDPNALSKYKEIGYKNAILGQWAANTRYMKKLNLNKDIEVSFIGFVNPWREYLIAYLKKQGIKVRCYGTGWDNGHLTVEGMNEIFNRSKIVLNMSNSVQYDIGYNLSVNLSVKWNWKLNYKTNIFRIFPITDTLFNGKRTEQIKARVFETPATGSFLLTYYIKGIERYFKLNHELICYASKQDLVKKIYYYLKHDKEREEIALMAYKKTVKEYSYNAILRNIINTVTRI